jgi:pimeloyl-ACP methyl ester carboxylesterase
MLRVSQPTARARASPHHGVSVGARAGRFNDSITGTMSAETATAAGSGATAPPDVQVSGDGPPLVLVPGMDGTGRLFHRQVPLLARSFRVATFALRDGDAHMSAHVERVASVIRAIAPGGEPAVVCGESFGGAVSLSLALAHPELVRALVVINSFPRFLPQHRLRMAIVGIRLIPWGAMAIVRRVTAFRMHSRYTHREELRNFLEQTKRTTREGYVNRLRVLERYDVRSELSRIAAPAIFVAAERDHLVPAVAQARYMAERVPGAKLRVLEGHGHICLIAPNVDLAAIIAQSGLLSAVPASVQYR